MKKTCKSARAQRREESRKSKQGVKTTSSQFENRNTHVIDWQKVVKKAKINLVNVFEADSAEILEHLEVRIFVDIQNQSENGMSFNYKELDVHKFLNKSKLDKDFASKASMNYYNACIIESKDFDNLIALMAIGVMSSIDEQFDQLNQVGLIKDALNSSGYTMVEVNDSYLKIKPNLIKRRWINEESNFYNSYCIGNKVVVENTPALCLVNDIFNITLKPHLNGVEISRLEVYEKYQGKSYSSKFLDNILLFLNRMDINEIYVMPFPSGFRTKKGISVDAKLLRSFFFKRGFRQLEGQLYWKLTNMTYLDSIAEMEIDYSLLEK